MLADKCLELMGKHEAGCDDQDFETLNIRAKAVKGLVELVHGNVESGTSKSCWTVYEYSLCSSFYI